MKRTSVADLPAWPGRMTRRTALAYLDMGATVGARVLDSIPSVTPPGSRERGWLKSTIDEHLRMWERQEAA